LSVSRKDVGSTRRKVDAYSGHRPDESGYESPETIYPRAAKLTGSTSKAVRRLITAFRRAAILAAKPNRPAAVSAQLVEQTSPTYPFPATQIAGDQQAAPPSDAVAKGDGRSPHWPWPSTVEAISGDLASKLRPGIPANEAPSRDLFGKLSRLLAGFVIGLAITWFVLSIYPIHTEVQDNFAAKAPPTSDRTTPDSVTSEHRTPAPTGEPAENAGEQLSPRIGALARQSDRDGETAAAPAAIPSVPLNLVVEEARGSEDTAIPLAISTTRVRKQDAENLTVTIAGLPEGARLSAGQEDGAGGWTLRPDQLSGLTLVPPDDYSGRFELSVSATIQDPGGDNETVAVPLVVNVSGVADLPSLAIDDASGTRDRPIPLFVDAALADRDGSERLSIVITGAPGGTVLSAGTGDGEDGWILAPGDLVGLTLRPPAGFSGRLDLTVAATSLEADGDRATATAALAVRVNAAIDHLALSVEDAVADEGSPVRLEIDTALNSGEPAERFSIVVADLPEGARLSAGRDQGGGSWLLNPNELAGLSLLPPAGYIGRFELRVAATVRRTDGDTVTATAPLAVKVTRATKTPPGLATDENLRAVARSLSSIKGNPVVAVAAESGDPQLRAQTVAQTSARDFMARGNQLLEFGDIAAARLFFELAMDHGEAQAATAVGKTYDPVYLRERGVQGAGGNPEMAMTWYKRAIKAGDLEAVERLKALAN